MELAAGGELVNADGNRAIVTRIQTRAEADALRAAWDGSLAALKAWAEAK